MFYDNPLFELHETMQGKDDSGTLINLEVLGKRFIFPSQRVDQGVRGSKARYVGAQICAMALRNTTGAALNAGALVQLGVSVTNTFGVLQTAEALATATTTFPIVAVSGYLGTKTVADDDIFWGIYQGPTKLLTASASLNDVSPGDRIVPAGTANGGFDKATLPGSLYAQAAAEDAFNWCGFALESVTGATDTSTLKWVQMCARV